MTKQHAAMQLALETLQAEAANCAANDPIDGPPESMVKAIAALRQAIEQPQADKPFRYFVEGAGTFEDIEWAEAWAGDSNEQVIPLYTRPQPARENREWVGLTDEEKNYLVLDSSGCVLDYEDYAEKIRRSSEATTELAKKYGISYETTRKIRLNLTRRDFSNPWSGLGARR